MTRGFCVPFFRLMLYFLSIALLFGNISAENAEAGSISGRVANGDGVGVGSVSISLFKSDGSPTSNSAISSQDGSYAISGLAAGSYKLIYYTPYGSGYLSQWYSNKNDINSADSIVVGVSQNTIANIALVTGGIISGRVTNSDGQGIETVTVGIYALSGSLLTTATTDGDGRYSVNGLSGSYKIFFNPSSIGYLAQWYGSKNDLASADAVHVTAPNTMVVNAVLATSGSLTGRVTNSDGIGIANVTVGVTDNLCVQIATGQSASDGSYVVSGLASGNYKVLFYFQSGSSQYLNQWHNNKSNCSSADTVAITAPNTTTVNAVLASAGTIAGRVTNANGEGIAIVSVLFYDGSGTGVGFVTTDADGRYSQNGFASGNYKVKFMPNNTNYRSQWFQNKADSSSADSVAVTAPNESVANSVLVAKGIISGRVTNADGTGVPSVSVQIYSQSGSNGGYASTAADGTFTVKGLEPGSYKAQFSKIAAGYTTQWFSNKPDQASANLITVADDTVSIADVVLYSKGVISGKVANANGTGIPGISVRIYKAGEQAITAEVQTDAEGNYIKRGLSSGSYKVYFFAYGNGYLSQWFNSKSDMTTADTIAVAEPQTTVVNATLQTGAVIEGQVTGPNGEIMSGISVGVYKADGTYVAGALIDTNGNYRVIGLSQGNYKIQFAPQYGVRYVSQWYSNKKNISAADVISVVLGQTYTINASISACSYSMKTPSALFGRKGGGASFILNADEPACLMQLNPTVNHDWLRWTGGNWSGLYKYDVAENNTGNSRIGTITVADQTFKIVQSNRLSPGGSWHLISTGDATINALSPDGQVAAGMSWLYDPVNGYGMHSFRWDLQSGLIDLGFLPEWSNMHAMGLSADGRIVIGYAYDWFGIMWPFLWSETHGLTNLGLPSNWLSAGALAVSDDGRVIVGEALDMSEQSRPFQWLSSSGFAELYLPAGFIQGSAFSASPDGSIIAGVASDSSGQVHAVRWTQGSGFSDLGVVSDGSASYEAIAKNGSIVVGTTPMGAFRWTNETGLVNLDGGSSQAVSVDGTVVVGSSVPHPIGDPYAFRWSEDRGMEVLSEWLVSNGVDVSGAVFSDASGVSADGRIIVGRSLNSLYRAGIYEFIIDPLFHTFKNVGGTQSIQVFTLHADKSWTASANVSWISITSGNSGVGAGTVQYSVEPNVTGLVRKGTVTVAGWLIEVVQGTPVHTDKIGVYGSGNWYFDSNANAAWNGLGLDQAAYFGFPGATPIRGDWDGNGIPRIGVYHDGYWYLDMNADGVWNGDEIDKTHHFGFAGAQPVAGDWNNTGATKIGIFANGYWYLDMNGNGAWDGEPTDKVCHFGFPGAFPVAGDWSGTGATKIGVYANGYWYLDMNGDCAWNAVQDAQYHFGFAGAVPVTGDWNNTGATKIGVYSDGMWYVDVNGNGMWDGVGPDATYHYGFSGAVPLTGSW